MDIPHPTSYVPLLLALVAGTVAGVACLLVARSVEEPPEEDREFKDPLPIGLRLIWRTVRLLSPAVTILLPDRIAGATTERLRKAGLEFTLTAPQFHTAQLVSSLGTALVLVQLVALCAPLLKIPTPPAYISVPLCLVLGWIYPWLWLCDREAMQRADIQKALPFYLDIITLCVEAGLNLPGALKQAVEKGPKGVLRNEFMRVLRDVRAGAGRAEALRSMATRLGEPDVTHFITATVLAEGMGASLGPVLRAQADQRRSERFIRAEKKAMQAPVKMLLPLILCIFPCTMIVILLPIAMKFLQTGY